MLAGMQNEHPGLTWEAAFRWVHDEALWICADGTLIAVLVPGLADLHAAEVFSGVAAACTPGSFCLQNPRIPERYRRSALAKGFVVFCSPAGRGMGIPLSR